MPRNVSDRLWIDAAQAAGWSWSRADGGYINDTELDPRGPGLRYWVAGSAREACERSGIETEAQAKDIIEERGA